MQVHVHHQFRAVFAVAVLALIAAGCSSSGGGAKCPFMHPDAAKIDAAKNVDADFVADFDKQDPDACASHYWNSPDAIIYPPGESEWHGHQAIRDGFAGFFQHMQGAKLELIDPHYMVCGSNVISNGHWTVTHSNGEPLQGRFTAVFAKKDGKWVMVLDHASVPMGQGR